jgi:acyl dehydratase
MSKFELRPGQWFTRQFKVTWWRVLLIALATGDFQPVHFWAWFGKLTRFKRGPIAHGVLISSLPVTVAGMNIIPKESRYHYAVIFSRALETEYRGPVFYGERLRVVVVVQSPNQEDLDNGRTSDRGWSRFRWSVHKFDRAGRSDSEPVAIGGYLLKIDEIKERPRAALLGWAESIAIDLGLIRRALSD